MQPLPHRSEFKHQLRQRYKPAEAAALVLSAQARYLGLLETIHPESSLRLRARLEQQILPTLALYQALLASGLNASAALERIQPVFLQVYFGALRQGLRIFSHLPLDHFSLVRPALRRLAAAASDEPPERVIDTPGCFAITSRRCAVVDALGERGAPELAQVFCASDDWLSAALPGVRWLRTTTLARGGPCCDFRWERVR